ncbi:hypothetical protein Tco_0912565, partial [Tanacetum coccineum]
MLVLYILPRLSSKTQVLWKLSCLLEAARQSLACIRLCLVCPSCLLEAAYVCDIRTSYVSRQCTSSDGDSAAPCLLRRLATPDWLALLLPLDLRWPSSPQLFQWTVLADHTTPPAPAGATIPRASLEEIAVTRPDRDVVAKADHAAKRKTSTGSEISTNTTKRTRLSQKVSGAGSSGLAARDEVEQTDDGTLDDDDQRDGLEFAVEDVGNLNDVGQGEHINVIPLRTFDPSLGLDVTYPPILLPDKKVEAHAKLSGGVRRTTRASSHASHGKLVSLFTFASNYT